MSQLGSLVTASSMGAIDQLIGDVGTATPAAGNVNVVGGLTTAGTININTRGSGNTLEVNLNDDVFLLGFLFAGENVAVPATASEFVGSFVLDGNAILHAFGVGNVFLGESTGNFTLTGTGNTVLGDSAGMALTNGTNNVLVGVGSGGSLTSGDQNVAVGRLALDSVTSGSFNVGVGETALDSLVSGSYNLALGHNAGLSIGTTSNSNIYLSNDGAAESNTIRIGTQGTGNREQDTTFIAGIHGVTPSGSSIQTVVIDDQGQLGSTASSSFAWNEETGTSASMAVNNGYIANNAGLVTLTLPAVAAVGDVIRVTGKGAGGWRIAQNAGQTIYFGTSTSTTGATGYLEFTATRDSVELVCVTANNDWNIISSIGNITVN